MLKLLTPRSPVLRCPPRRQQGQPCWAQSPPPPSPEDVRPAGGAPACGDSVFRDTEGTPRVFQCNARRREHRLSRGRRQDVYGFSLNVCTWEAELRICNQRGSCCFPQPWGQGWGRGPLVLTQEHMFCVITPPTTTHTRTGHSF